MCERFAGLGEAAVDGIADRVLHEFHELLVIAALERRISCGDGSAGVEAGRLDAGIGLALAGAMDAE